MINLLFSLALASQCPETKIVNKTSEWTAYDQETLNRAKIRCGELYSDAPCAKTFIKKDATTYSVVCGK